MNKVYYGDANQTPQVVFGFELHRKDIATSQRRNHEDTAQQRGSDAQFSDAWLPVIAPPARCWVQMTVRSRSVNVPNNDGNGYPFEAGISCP